MILGPEDIAGGTAFVAFLIWLALSGLFFLVSYLAVLNTIDDFTGNSFLKIPALLALAPLSAFIMAIFNYNPTILVLVAAVTNYYRIRKLPETESKKLPKGNALNKPMFYTGSYLYLAAIYALAVWFQSPTEFDGATVPLWQSWFPSEDIH